MSLVDSSRLDAFMLNNKGLLLSIRDLRNGAFFNFRKHVDFMIELATEIPKLNALVFIEDGGDAVLHSCRTEIVGKLRYMNKFLRCNGGQCVELTNRSRIFFSRDVDRCRGFDLDVVVVKTLNGDDR